MSREEDQEECAKQFDREIVVSTSNHRSLPPAHHVLNCTSYIRIHILTYTAQLSLTEKTKYLCPMRKKEGFQDVGPIQSPRLPNHVVPVYNCKLFVRC